MPPKPLTEAQMLGELRLMVEKHGVRGVARQLGVYPAWISNVMRGRQGMTAPLAEKMGYKRVVIYKLIK